MDVSLALTLGERMLFRLQHSAVVGVSTNRPARDRTR